MKFTNLQRRSISLLVLATFVALLHFWAMPAPAATGAGTSETAIAQGDSGGPGFIEEESSSEPVITKAKKFPWLFVGLGVVAVGVALYFLVIKKPQYTLTVTLGTGCSGTPAATTKYKKGEVVSYNYTAPTGYAAQVTLDGAAVAASGTVTMDKDHALAVTPQIDIRGAWGFACSATNVVKHWTWNMTFAGNDPKAGTVSFFDWAGTFTVTGNTVSIKFSLFNTDDLVFTGTLSSPNAMAGTAVLTNLTVGGTPVTGLTFTATRGAAASSSGSRPALAIK
jgi:hypothetical protein